MGIAATMYDSLDNTTAGPEPLKSNIPNKNKSQTDDMRDTFLKMIVTQMQNQDPTKPMENAELTSQLAQIATLESMNKLSDKVSGISSQIGSGQSLQATQLVGKGVLIPRNEIVLAPLKTQMTVIIRLFLNQQIHYLMMKLAVRCPQPMTMAEMMMRPKGIISHRRLVSSFPKWLTALRSRYAIKIEPLFVPSLTTQK